MRLQQFNTGPLLSEIGFQTDEDERRGRTEVEHFGVPFVHDVFEAVGAVDGEADEDEVGFGVGEGAQAVVFFLAGGVPESELDGFVGGCVEFLGDVVFEDGGDVALWERRG